MPARCCGWAKYVHLRIEPKLLASDASTMFGRRETSQYGYDGSKGTLQRKKWRNRTFTWFEFGEKVYGKVARNVTNGVALNQKPYEENPFLKFWTSK
jgi:hypothetical protein